MTKRVTPSQSAVDDFKIRRARAEDMGVLLEQRNAMFDEYARMTAEERKTASSSYPVWARDLMKKKLFHGYIVETSRGQVAASGCVWLREKQPSRGHPSTLVPYVMSIYTKPRFRRRGLASMIVEEAMAWARKSGYPEMYLHASTAGRKVYSKLGWKRTWEMAVRLDSESEPARLKPRRVPQPSRPSRASKRSPPAQRRRLVRG